MTHGVNQMIKAAEEFIHQGGSRRSQHSRRSRRRATDSDSDDSSEADAEDDVIPRKMTQGIRHRTSGQNKLAVSHLQPILNSSTQSLS